MPKKTDKKSSRKGQLSPNIIVGAALKIADSKGLDALTMRALATALGVEAMSLYYHVKNKDALLALMVDQIFGKIYTPKPDQPWRAEMEARAHSMQKVLKKHNWSLPVIESIQNPGEANLRHHEAVLACLINSGFSITLTAHAYALLDAYIYGFVMQEIALPFSTYEQVKPIAEHILASMDQAAFPSFYALTTQHVLKPGYDFSKEFHFGLEIILEGLNAKLQAQSGN